MKPNRTPAPATVVHKPAGAKLTLVGDAATLKAIHVLGFSSPEKVEKYNVELSIDVPVTTACKYPLDDLVLQVVSRSNHEEQKEKRTTKVQLRRKYENVRVLAKDILRAKEFAFEAEIVGAPQVTILDGGAAIRVRVKTLISTEEFNILVRMLNTQRTFQFDPLQTEITDTLPMDLSGNQKPPEAAGEVPPPEVKTRKKSTAEAQPDVQDVEI